MSTKNAAQGNGPAVISDKDGVPEVSRNGATPNSATPAGGETQERGNYQKPLRPIPDDPDPLGNSYS